MSFESYMHAFWTKRDFNRIDAMGAQRRRMERRRQRDEARKTRDLQERLAALEGDLGRAVLLLRGLTDLCIERGVIDAVQLGEHMERLDSADGETDGMTGMDRARSGGS